MIESEVVKYISFFAGFIVSVAAAWAIIMKWFKKQVVVIIQEATCKNNEAFQQQIKTLTEKLEDFIELQQRGENDIKENLMSLTQDRINQAHSYYMNMHTIDELSMFLMEKLYASYKTLKGNGHVESLMADLREISKNKYIDSGKPKQ